MSATSMQLEHMHIDARTRRATLWSIVAHALLIVWMVIQPHVFEEPPELTEITWIDPESLQPQTPSAARTPEPVQVTEKRTAAPSPAKEPQHFERRPKEAPAQPTPQLSRALQDRLSHRLTAMQAVQRRDAESPASLQAPTPIAGIRPARPTEDTRPPAVDMKRDAAPSQSAVTLKRVETPAAVPRLARVRAPQPQRQSARAQDVDPSQVRHLAGASLMGPVADRALLAHGKPTYPEWAKKQAIEASVTLYFIVRPDGRIKENVLVEKTSGFEEFDLNAIRALRGWKFEPLAPGTTGEQWGQITFHFRLR